MSYLKPKKSQRVHASFIKLRDSIRLLKKGGWIFHSDSPNNYETYKNGKLWSYKGSPSRIIYTSLVYTQEWHCNGEYHSYDENPSRIVQTPNNKITTEWHLNGLLQSLNNGKYPSRTISDPELESSLKEWHKNGLLHSFNGKPSSYEGTPYGYIKQTHKNGLLQSINDEPSYVRFLDDRDFNGRPDEEYNRQQWHTNGLLNRDEFKPAEIYGHIGSMIKYYAYYQNGMHKYKDDSVLGKLNCTDETRVIHAHFYAYDDRWCIGKSLYRRNEMKQISDIIVRCILKFRGRLIKKKQKVFNKFRNVKMQLENMPGLGIFPGGIHYQNALENFTSIVS